MEELPDFEECLARHGIGKIQSDSESDTSEKSDFDDFHHKHQPPLPDITNLRKVIIKAPTHSQKYEGEQQMPETRTIKRRTKGKKKAKKNNTQVHNSNVSKENVTHKQFQTVITDENTVNIEQSTVIDVDNKSNKADAIIPTFLPTHSISNYNNCNPILNPSVSPSKVPGRNKLVLENFDKPKPSNNVQDNATIVRQTSPIEQQRNWENVPKISSQNFPNESHDSVLTLSPNAPVLNKYLLENFNKPKTSNYEQDNVPIAKQSSPIEQQKLRENSAKIPSHYDESHNSSLKSSVFSSNAHVRNKYLLENFNKPKTSNYVQDNAPIVIQISPIEQQKLRENSANIHSHCDESHNSSLKSSTSSSNAPLRNNSLLENFNTPKTLNYEQGNAPIVKQTSPIEQQKLPQNSEKIFSHCDESHNSSLKSSISSSNAPVRNNSLLKNFNTPKTSNYEQDNVPIAKQTSPIEQQKLRENSAKIPSHCDESHNSSLKSSGFSSNAHVRNKYLLENFNKPKTSNYVQDNVQIVKQTSSIEQQKLRENCTNAPVRNEPLMENSIKQNLNSFAVTSNYLQDNSTIARITSSIEQPRTPEVTAKSSFQNDIYSILKNKPNLNPLGLTSNYVQDNYKIVEQTSTIEQQRKLENTATISSRNCLNKTINRTTSSTDNLIPRVECSTEDLILFDEPNHVAKKTIKPSITNQVTNPHRREIISVINTPPIVKPRKHKHRNLNEVQPPAAPQTYINSVTPNVQNINEIASRRTEQHYDNFINSKILSIAQTRLGDNQSTTSSTRINRNYSSITSQNIPTVYTISGAIYDNENIRSRTSHGNAIYGQSYQNLVDSNEEDTKYCSFCKCIWKLCGLTTRN